MLKGMNSIRKKLILVVTLLMAVPMLIVVIITHRQSQEIIRMQAFKLGTNLVSSAADRLSESNAGIDDIFRSIYLNDSFREYLRGNNYNSYSVAEKNHDVELLKNAFLSCMNSRSDVFSIIYVDEMNQVFYATRNEAGSYSSYFNCDLPEAYIQRLEEVDSNLKLIPTHVHMPLRKVRQDTPVFVYAAARTILNTERHFENVGTMFITFDLSGFQRISELMLSGSESQLLICDANENIIYHAGDNPAGNANRNSQGSAQKSVADRVISDSHSYVVAQADISDSGWKIMLLTPRASFSADALSVTKTVAITVAVALVISAFITAGVSVAFSRPIEQLAEVMDEVQLNRLERRVQVEGNDEIARLGNSFNHLMDKLDHSLKREYDAVLQQKDAEIRALQAQMNPHFICNVLQSIAAMANIRHAPELAEMATLLGKTIRYSITGTDLFVTMREEMDYVNNYLHIQSLRYGNRLSYQVNTPEYLMNNRIPKVSIQPLVENAIVHGLEHITDGGFLTITAWEDKQSMVIEVADNGTGMQKSELQQLQCSLSSEEKPQDREHIGLRNLNLRLHLLYGEEGSMTVESEENTGTVVRIVLPAER